MADNLNQKSIYVETDYDNIILIDPNKVVDENKKVKEENFLLKKKKKFGTKNLPEKVKKDKGEDPYAVHTIVHAVYPRETAGYGANLLSKNNFPLSMTLGLK